MSPSPNTFIAAPVRYGASISSRAKSTLMKVEDTLAKGSVTVPTANDQIGLWLCLQEWSNKNLAALEGERAGHAAGSGAAAGAVARDTGGEGTQD